MPEQFRINLYHFEELSGEAKKRVLKEFRYVNVEDSCWDDGEIDYWEARLLKCGFINPKIQYSGFSSQGDGASFTCESINFKKLNRLLKLKIPKPLIDHFSGNITRCNHHYYHENTINVNIDLEELEYSSEIRQLLADIITKDVLSRTEREITNFVKESCRTIYRALENLYDSEITDETVIDTIECNDWTFLKDGEFFTKRHPGIDQLPRDPLAKAA